MCVRVQMFTTRYKWTLFFQLPSIKSLYYLNETMFEYNSSFYWKSHIGQRYHFKTTILHLIGELVLAAW